MNKEIERILRENKITYRLIIIIKELYYNIFRHNVLMLGAFFRRKNISGKRYIKLKKYKNIHEGKRCFIIATGPSLTIDDVKLLKNEYTFAVNSFLKVIDKIGWAPTYYGIQDKFVYETLESDILKSNLNDVFIGNSINKKTKRPKNSIEYPLAYCGREYGFDRKKYKTKFSDDIFSIVYDGYTVTYSMIQIAVYMGFKEIYLLGCDCNYTIGENNYFIETKKNSKNILSDNYLLKSKDRMTTAYIETKKYTDKNGIKVFNATRGGMLEVFPRVRLEDILNKGC